MGTPSKTGRRLLVVQAAGLGFDFFERNRDTAGELGDLVFRPMSAPFPGLTCPVQATMRTGLAPLAHGVPANGLWFGDLRRPAFWEQSCRLVAGARAWDRLRTAGGRVALLFWQQSLGEEADFILSPMPVHKHGGGMIEAFYSKPDTLYTDLCAALGRRFRLARYWGPFASPAASRWIALATAALMRGPLAPDLCLTYLPALDYDLQRHGPDSGQAVRALRALAGDLRILLDAAGPDRDTLVFGDYAIGPARADGVVFPNIALRRAGLFRTRLAGGMLYPDMHASRAFAVADHELAFVHADSESDAASAAAVLAGVPGVAKVLRAPELEASGLLHPRGGRLAAVAGEGHWFAYPWWERGERGPDYAAHVDIHNKPGYDPTELFHGWPPFTISGNPARIRGSHGRDGPDRRVCLGAAKGLGSVEADAIPQLAAWLGVWCGNARQQR